MDEHERVIEGVLHRRQGDAWVPMGAQELTTRLLEARRCAMAGGFPIFVWPTPRGPQLGWMPGPDPDGSAGSTH